jgi:hypothetical protein
MFFVDPCHASLVIGEDKQMSLAVLAISRRRCQRLTSAFRVRHDACPDTAVAALIISDVHASRCDGQLTLIKCYSSSIFPLL